MDDNKVIFSSEFESDGIKKGANSVIASLTQIKDQQTKLTESIKDYSEAIKINDKDILGLHKRMQDIVLDSKVAINQYKDLEKQTAELTNVNQTYRGELAATQVKLSALTTQHNNFSKAIAETTKQHGYVIPALQKFGSVGHLMGEEIQLANRRVARFGIDLAVGFAGGLLGIAIPAVAKLAKQIVESFGPIDKLSEKQKELNEIFKDAGKNAGAQVAQLDAYKEKLNDLNLPAAERIKIAKEYNKVADETNKIDLKQIDNLVLINAQISKQNELVIQRAISTAALAKLTETANKVVETELKLREELRSSGLTEEEAIKGAAQVVERQTKQRENVEKNLDDGIIKSQQRFKPLVKESQEAIIGVSESLRQALAARDRAKFLLEDQTKLISPLISVDGLTTKDPKPKKERKGPENVYEQKLLELRARMAKITEEVFQNEGLIRQEFSTQLDKEFGEIDKLLKEKKLTNPQSATLKSLLTDINSVELSKSLDEFRKKRLEAETKLSDEIQALQLELSTKRIAGIENEFERETAAIDQALTKTLSDIKKKEREALRDLQNNKLLSQEQKDFGTIVLEQLFGDLATEAGEKAIRDKSDKAFKAFEALVQDITATFDEALTSDNENATKRIVEAAKLYMKGAISFEEFEKRKTKIVREETHNRNLILIHEAEIRIQLLKDEFDALDQNDPNKKKTGKQLDAARNALSGLQRSDADNQASGKNKDEDEKIKRIVAYTQAIGSLANEVIGFWAKVNEVEQKQIERSIALQEKRVTAAQRIASRGNAEYLRQEEDRLTQLQIKQENAAKKQLAINAVLQASQALVAFVSALAKGAEIGGPLGAIASAAAVVGLLASGYAIVKSLQNQSPKLFTGSKNVQRTKGEPVGKDTINAWINEGEAVIPTNTNKEYHPTVEAVYDRTVPASVLNEFVKSYPKNKIPGVNYNRIGESAEFKVNSDGKLVALLAEQNKEMRETREIMQSVDDRLKNLGVHVGMDKEGIVASITTTINRRTISSKA